MLTADLTALGRYDPDGALTVVGTWSSTGAPAPFSVVTRAELGGRNMATLVSETGRPGRIDHYADATGTAVDLARELGFHSAVGAPITVEGRLWGARSVVSTGAKPLPADIEVRLAGFTDLVATAIANAQARLELRGHAEERSALRRVAPLAARAARTSPSWPGTTRTAYRRPSVRGAAPVPCPSPSAPRRGWATGT